MRLSSVLGNWNIRKFSSACQGGTRKEKKKKTTNRAVFPNMLSGLVLNQLSLKEHIFTQKGKMEVCGMYHLLLQFWSFCKFFCLDSLCLQDLITWRFGLHYGSHCCCAVMFKGIRQPEAPITSPDNVLNCATAKPHHGEDLWIFLLMTATLFGTTAALAAMWTSASLCSQLKLGIKKKKCLTNMLQCRMHVLLLGVYLHKLNVATLPQSIAIKKSMHFSDVGPRLTKTSVI